MFHDPKSMPLSPQKNKPRENKNWQFGWWDFHSLAEQTLRPIEWSQSSVIFSAHPLQPLVTAHHFSSSKRFVIPSPAPIVSSPSSFGPPTVISISPGDVWLFAYFPGFSYDGIACMWKRGPQIDSWVIKEYWSITQGSGIVAACWLGLQREWVMGTTPSSSTRLSPRGPPTPVSSPTLLLVTQDYHVTLCYLRHYMSSLKFITCSIAQPGGAVEGQSPSGDTTFGNLRRCSLAAIGLGYNENAIIIATRSCNVPLPKKHETHSEDTHPSLTGEINQLLPPDFSSLEWDSWHEESTINLCEVQLIYTSSVIALVVDTLPPLLHYGGTLVGLDFISIPPSSDKESTSSSQYDGKIRRGQLFLTASWLDFGNYTSTPKSDLSVYSISRQPPVPGSSSPKPTWGFHQNATRTFSPSILAFILPFNSGSNKRRSLVYAGVIDTSGSLPDASRIKRASIGNIRVLNLLDLSDNEDYVPSQIVAELSKIGQDLPLNAALSPNGSLLATAPSSMWPLRAFVHMVPKSKNTSNAQGKLLPPLAIPLASAIVSGRSATDVVHVLSLGSTSAAEVSETLLCASDIIDGALSRSESALALGLVGEVMAVYRQRSLNSEDGDEGLLVTRWKTAHDICSLAALTKAFEDCREGETYDLDAVWQLIALATWLVSFSEKIVKECVVSGALIPELAANEHTDKVAHLDSSGPHQHLDAPTLLHLVHPLPLSNFVDALKHLQQYRAYVGSLSARGENGQIAKDVLVDLFDNSGIDFAALKDALGPTLGVVEAFDNNSCRRALILCQPVPAMYHHLRQVIPKIRDSCIVNKPLLFIKPYDFVDGIARLALAPKKDKDKDVISKRVLVGTDNKLVCMRCGGQTAIMEDLHALGDVSPQWRAWEQTWILRCVCGGKWGSS